jgi:hypothetical protein
MSKVSVPPIKGTVCNRNLQLVGVSGMGSTQIMHAVACCFALLLIFDPRLGLPCCAHVVASRVAILPMFGCRPRDPTFGSPAAFMGALFRRASSATLPLETVSAFASGFFHCENSKGKGERARKKERKKKGAQRV